MTISLPDDLAGELRRLARLRGKSLSSVVVELARPHLRPASWSEELKDLFGADAAGREQER